MGMLETLITELVENLSDAQVVNLANSLLMTIKANEQMYELLPADLRTPFDRMIKALGRSEVGRVYGQKQVKGPGLDSDTSATIKALSSIPPEVFDRAAAELTEAGDATISLTVPVKLTVAMVGLLQVATRLPINTERTDAVAHLVVESIQEALQSTCPTTAAMMEMGWDRPSVH